MKPVDAIRAKKLAMELTIHTTCIIDARTRLVLVQQLFVSFNFNALWKRVAKITHKALYPRKEAGDKRH